MAKNCKSAQQDAEFRVTLELITLLGMVALLRNEPATVQRQASEVILRHVEQRRCPRTPAHNELRCVRNSLAHMSLRFHIKNGHIEGIFLRDATPDERKENLHHWESLVRKDALQVLIAELAQLG